jgi:alpha-D-ribose 1-methylphosphonate 5-triphosphate synthase subunit PhnH
MQSGFADPVFDAQRAFRAAMNALAQPGTLQALESSLVPPAPLPAELAALALTLFDHETPFWLDAPLATPDVVAFLRFHTGAPAVADPADAAFALVLDAASCPLFSAFAQGVPAYPDRSATLILAVQNLAAEGGLVLSGPGIREHAMLSADPLPADFIARWAANRQLAPCGVDVLLAAAGCVVGLPRSVQIERR